MIVFQCRTGGNAFATGPAPPPPPYTAPPPSHKPVSGHNTSGNPRNRSPNLESPPSILKDQNSDKGGLASGVIAGIAIAGILVAAASVFIIIFFVRRSPRRKHVEEEVKIGFPPIGKL